MVTIRDVAEEAGVSVSTVSRVLSGSDKISEATARHVKEVADRCGYRRDYVATAMKTGRTWSLGLITGAIENPFFAVLANNVESAARRHGYSLTIVNGQENAEAQRNAAQVIASKRVDGVIIVPAGGISASDIAPLGESIPTVAVDRTIDSPSIPSLIASSEEAIDALVCDIADNGFASLAFIGGPLNTSTGATRRAAILSSCARRALHVAATVTCPYDSEESYRAAPSLFAGRTPDIIVCGSGALALGVMRYLAENGIHIGVDVGLAAFDNLFLFQCTIPQISVIDSSIDLAEQSVDLLVSMIENGQESHSSTTARIISRPARYIPRASTRPLARA